MKKKTVRIVGYCSRWEEGIGWVVDVPLEDVEMAIEEMKRKPKLLGYCECCGKEIYEGSEYVSKDGVLNCYDCLED